MAQAMQGPPGYGPVMVLNSKTQRQTGRQAQLSNITAARAVADIIRSTLGPRSMLKMLLDPMGGVVITNDGNCILREVDVSHPTAKSMIELSRAQDEEVGDGTTSVIILAGELLILSEQFIRNNLHPTVIVQGYNRALQEALKICERQALVVDINDNETMLKLVNSSIGTKFSSRWNSILVEMALKAVRTVARASSTSTDGSSSTYYNKMEVDIKRYAKVEKIPGGEISDSRVLKGVMFNKDVTHSKMRRRIEKPRILLLDCPLEYKKGETQTNVEITNTEDWNTMLRMEEEYVENMCMEIIAFQPDIVITEKGVSDLAQHYLAKADITAFRRLRKTDNNRVARATGAIVVSRTDEIQESDIGTGCGLFEMKKIGEEWFVFLDECEDPKACSIILRGGSKDVLNEIERNLADAMEVIRNVVYDPKLLPGGGATEMAVAMGLRRAGLKIEGVQQHPFQAVGEAMEVIPRTLAQNCGVSVIRTVTQLRAKHAASYDEFEQGGTFKPCTWGINGVTGKLVEMDELGIWEPFSVKVQTIKTAIESACMILRIDDIVSGSKKGKQ
uniref:T-complex protein 1 subunit gamma n=1 Tax=Eucampia antarctica TaxID=49252 RepID=A0A7S2VZH4_9STRA|mmetsp:Transcript_15648/g.15045  ORF Transcript_15648/g.15045 Transcript_15648/m.15045 type:complete len:560 (+) Transcript_15648:70-1749(+)|eukprot:CAMPEP_0197831410 /NCGR_PEP_ID=MMETSP1437-20131217/9906_1 /TAXON_ID=49252 ORGANISM="Eucampia antarctica, Strain CCMP1452" /NCGR_SAMPLE_ID=MMETSP1437 /ASSEMBLY_ACC=CAM_ASM_001096 /LENGTH=559 /DNA_ID=CAMNT_0043434313 /DNA_START=62 /DNA_END=1741 /DNA_ORIENTATION=+